MANRLFGKTHLPAALALALLTACNPFEPGNGTSEIDQGGTGNGEGFRLKSEAVFDPMVNNNAITFLKPEGWVRQGGVEWRHDMAIHASLNMTVHNPETGDLLAYYPIVPFSYIPNPVVPIAPGTPYLGTIFREPITDLGFFLNEFYFKSFRSNATNASVVSTEPLADVANSVWRELYGSSPDVGVRAVKWNVQYTMGGVDYEESFFCAISYTSNPAMPGSVIWQPEYVYSIRARRGEMMRAQGLLQAMAYSVQLDMKWFALYMQVHQLWQQGQMQAIRNAGELSRYIANINNDINNTIISSYEKAQESEDRIFDSFSESIRGVETYDNPVTGQPVQLPSDFKYAYVSTGGEFFLTNSTADPNVGSTTNWRILNAR